MLFYAYNLDLYKFGELTSGAVKNKVAELSVNWKNK